MSRIHPVLVALALAFGARPALADPGTAFTVQGELRVAGVPAEGAYDFRLGLYAAESGGMAIDVQSIDDAPVSGGLFTVAPDFTEVPFAAHQAYWIGIEVREGNSTGGYTTLQPRQRLRAAPYALTARAVRADGVDGAALASDAVGAAEIAANAVGASEIGANAVGTAEIDASQVQRRIATACPAGQSIRSVDAAGTPTCIAAGSGTITGVTAGSGLTGGGTSGSITLAIANGGVGSAEVADGSLVAADVDGSQIQRRIANACPAGQAIRGIDAAGAPTCVAVGAGTITGVSATAGLVGGGSSGTVSLGIGNGGVTGAMVADGAIGNAKLAVGAVNASRIDATQVQRRITGNCPVGAISAIAENGAVTCNGELDAGVLRPALANYVLGAGRGSTSSIAIGSDGFPVVANDDDLAGVIRVHHCRNFGCTAREQHVIASGDLSHPSIAVLGGRPAVAFRDAVAGALRIALCGDAACSSANVVTLRSGNVGEFARLVPNTFGLPAVVHYDRASGDLRVDTCAATDCSVVNGTLLDGAGDVGQNLAAVVISGRLVVAYHATTTQQLKIATCTLSLNGCSGVTSFVADATVGAGAAAIAMIGGVDGRARAFWTRGGELVTAGCTGTPCFSLGASTVLPISNVTHLAVTTDAAGHPFGFYRFVSGPEYVTSFRCMDIACAQVLTGPGISNLGAGLSLDGPIAAARSHFGNPVYTWFGDGQLRMTLCATPSCAAESAP